MNRLKDRPFALIGVNVIPRDAGKLREVMDREGLPWRSFADPGTISRTWNVTGTPTFYVIDPEGVIRHKWVGSPGDTIIDTAVEKLIGVAEGK